MEEVRTHCELCCDDKNETSEIQAEKIRRQRRSGDRRVAFQERRVRITVDKVLRARRKMLRNNANGPADCLVTEMLRCLPKKSVYEVPHLFHKRFEESVVIRRRGKFYLKTRDAKLEKGLRGYRAIALLNVFFKWYTAFLVDIAARGKRDA